MVIKVLEIAGVATPKSIFGRFDYLCTCFLRLLHNCINFFFAVYVMSDSKFSGARRLEIPNHPMRDTTSLCGLDLSTSPILFLLVHVLYFLLLLFLMFLP